MRRKRKKRRFWLRFFVSFFLRSEISKPSFYSFISFQIAKMKPRFSHVYSNENVILSVYDNFFHLRRVYRSTSPKFTRAQQQKSGILYFSFKKIGVLLVLNDV